MFVPYCFKIGRECPFADEIEKDPRLIFVLMPFATEFDEIYQQGIKPTWEELGFRVLRADEEFHIHDIMCRAICQNIQRARFIVADMTGRNPNVFYELGLAHAFGKPVILITQHKDYVPFDLQAILYINYGVGRENIAELRRGLKRMAEGLLATEAAPQSTSPKLVDLVSDRVSRRLPEVIVWEKDSKEMVLIPAGEFLMGTSEARAQGLAGQGGQDFFSRETPQHRVYQPDFYMDRYPVTNAQYRQFIEAGGYETEAYWTEAGWTRKEQENWQQPRLWDDARFNGDRQPVVGVSWYEALAYARWAGKILPGEAQWEKAAGWDPAARQKRKYPWGDAWKEDKGNIGNKHEQTTDVGSYPEDQSAYGLLDVAGNVREWCRTRPPHKERGSHSRR